jgi:hypothetical protein
MFEGEYGDDLFDGNAGAFDQDRGDETAVAALDELITRLNAAPDDDVMASLAPIVDWDRVLRMIAVEVFIGHWDGYGPTRNNYFLHLDGEGRWSLLPWGVDQTFDYPWPIYDGQGLLMQRCLGDQQCRAAYESALRETAATAAALLDAGFDDEITALADDNVDRFDDDPRGEWNPDDVPELADRALNFMRGRIDEVDEALACSVDPDADVDGDGFACGLDCDEGNPDIYVGAVEVCGNDVDEDCSGRIDDDDACPDCVVDDSDAARPLMICRVERTYENAAARCAQDGMRLVAIHDRDDNEAVYARAVRRLGDASYWIGLDDRRREGTFDYSDGRTWVRGTDDSDQVWADGEPNDAGGNEDCAHVWGFISAWNDIPCDVAFSAVCEPD